MLDRTSEGARRCKETTAFVCNVILWRFKKEFAVRQSGSLGLGAHVC